MDWHDNNGHPIAKSNTIFYFNLFQLAISLSFTDFLYPQLFILFKVNANSKYERWWKIINISVSMDKPDNNGHPISKSNTIFYFNLFQLAISLSFTDFLYPQLFILFKVNANSKYERWWKIINMSVSMD